MSPLEQIRWDIQSRLEARDVTVDMSDYYSAQLAALDALIAERDALRKALESVMECPTVTDVASCPNGDASHIDEAPPYQAVISICCSWTRYKLLKAALHGTAKQEQNPIDSFASKCPPVLPLVRQTINDKFFELLDKPRTCGECSLIHRGECPFPKIHQYPTAACNYFHPRADAQKGGAR